MKTLLIFVLVIALAAAAFFTRPNQASFNAYYAAQPSASASSSSGGLSLKGVFQNLQSNSYLSSVTYHDRLLWTSITSDGKPGYIGAFGHWFKQS